MDQVFAPWRIEWVERDDPETDVECVFCDLPTREDDRDSRIVARSGTSFVLLNNYPYNPGHAMVIPHHHTGDFRALDDETLLDHSRLTQRTLDALADSFAPDGFNTGMNLGGNAAGGSIDDHLHEHVVPRWERDTNFMPVIGDTTVIVESVAETYERLHDAFAEQEGANVAGENTAVTFE